MMKSLRFMFKNRQDAAAGLYNSLPIERMRDEQWSIMAISSGGLFIAQEINKRLNLPLDLIITAAITAPNNSDCELARVSESEEIVINHALLEAFDVQIDYIYGEATRKYEDKILADAYRYRKGELLSTLKNKTILLVDEGSESGLKLMCAIKTALEKKAKAIYVAVPIMPIEVYDSAKALVDDIFSIAEVEDYIDTRYYYFELDDIKPDMIEEILEKNSELQRKHTNTK